MLYYISKHTLSLFSLSSAQRASTTNSGTFNTSSIARSYKCCGFTRCAMRIRQDQDFFFFKQCLCPPTQRNLLFQSPPFLPAFATPPPLYFSPPAPTPSSLPQHGRAEFSWEGINVSLLVFRSPSFHPPKSLSLLTPPPHLLTRYLRFRAAVTSRLFIRPATLSYLSPPLPPSYPREFWFLFLPPKLPFLLCPQTPPNPNPHPVSSLGPPLIYCNCKLQIYTESLITGCNKLIWFAAEAFSPPTPIFDCLCTFSRIYLFAQCEFLYCRFKYAREQII